MSSRCAREKASTQQQSADASMGPARKPWARLFLGQSTAGAEAGPCASLQLPSRQQTVCSTTPCSQSQARQVARSHSVGAKDRCRSTGVGFEAASLVFPPFASSLGSSPPRPSIAAVHVPPPRASRQTAEAPPRVCKTALSWPIAAFVSSIHLHAASPDFHFESWQRSTHLHANSPDF